MNKLLLVMLLSLIPSLGQAERIKGTYTGQWCRIPYTTGTGYHVFACDSSGQWAGLDYSCGCSSTSSNCAVTYGNGVVVQGTVFNKMSSVKTEKQSTFQP